MEQLGEDEIYSILDRINSSWDRKSFATVCKKVFRVASFCIEILNIRYPDLLYLVIASPKMKGFICEVPLSNNHMKLLSSLYPNIEKLALPINENLDPEVGKLEFNDVGLQAVADACLHLVEVNLSGRLRFTEKGIGSLVRSNKNLQTLCLQNCVNVTNEALKVIAEATCLDALNLSGCYLITDLGLEYLANGDSKHCLDTLYLCECDEITDEGMNHLKKLVTLCSLDLYKCGGKITDKGIVAPCEIPNLEFLNLGYLFKITDDSLLEIGRKCLNIQCLMLTRCRKITGVGLRGLSGLKYLVQLSLVSCYNISWEDIHLFASTFPGFPEIVLSRSMKKLMPDNINGRDYNIFWH